MARARNIKPGFFLNDELAELSPLTRLLFIGLWCIADREGYLEDKPNKIKAEILPYDECDVNKMLEELNGEFIQRYSVNGKKYIFITNFKKHQNPHMKEKISEIPRITEVQKKNSNSTVQVQYLHNTSPADSLKLIPDSGYLNADAVKPIANDSCVDGLQNAISDSCVDGLSTTAVDDSCVDGLQAIIDFYNSNIGLISPYIVETLEYYLKYMDYEVIVYAMQKAVDANIRTMQYIKGTLNNWRQNGIKTLIQAQEENQRFRENKQKSKENELETKEQEIARRAKELEEALKNDTC